MVNSILLSGDLVVLTLQHQPTGRAILCGAHINRSTRDRAYCIPNSTTMAGLILLAPILDPRRIIGCSQSIGESFNNHMSSVLILSDRMMILH